MNPASTMQTGITNDEFTGIGLEAPGLMPEPFSESSLPDQSIETSHAAALKSKIMVVDDEPVNVKLVRKFLTLAGYEQFCITTDPTKAMEMISFEHPDLIFLDIAMPNISGLELLEMIRENPISAHTPVIILTAHIDQETKKNALELGASDFLAKPIDPSDLTLRARNCLVVKAYHDHLKAYARIQELKVMERTAELTQTRLQVIHCLARASEYRDNETGRHVIRVGKYCGIIARKLGLDPATVELIEHAAPLHDIGKIGIPDAILLKPGKLDPEEFAFMQQHCRLGKNVFERIADDEWVTVQTHTDLGSKIMKGTNSPLMEMAARISLTHHEKWNGQGYPLALAGEDIPIEGRITAVADVFDALSSERPYKKAFPQKKCLEIMEEGRGEHFDSRVLDAFLDSLDEVVAIQIKYSDI